MNMNKNGGWLIRKTWKILNFKIQYEHHHANGINDLIIFEIGSYNYIQEGILFCFRLGSTRVYFVTTNLVNQPDIYWPTYGEFYD